MIFKHLQAGQRVCLWLYDNLEQRLEGKIIVSRVIPAFQVVSCIRPALSQGTAVEQDWSSSMFSVCGY